MTQGQGHPLPFTPVLLQWVPGTRVPDLSVCDSGKVISAQRTGAENWKRVFCCRCLRTFIAWVCGRVPGEGTRRNPTPKAPVPPVHRRAHSWGRVCRSAALCKSHPSLNSQAPPPRGPPPGTFHGWGINVQSICDLSRAMRGSA